MYKPRKLNPLGIRKLDVQGLRRQLHKDMKGFAQDRFNAWFSDTRYQGAMPLTEENITRLIEVAYSDGWERGVREGAQATRDRVAEALERGTLLKGDGVR
jgi:hypothetical protein